MTRERFLQRLTEIVQDTEISTHDDAWIDRDKAENTAKDIIKFLRTVYDLEELVH